MPEREPTESQPLRQLDAELGAVSLFGEVWTLRLTAALSDEPYRRSLRTELVPLTAERGTRTVVHAQPYLLIPHITLDVSPSAAAPAWQFGTVTGSHWEGMRPEYVGQAVGWYYHEDRLLVLWEVLLEDRYQTGEAPADANLQLLWRGFEALLLRQFPGTHRIVTGADEPRYATADYQRFLRAVGYEQLSPRAFGKIPLA